jgi:hypothetical protein
MEQQVKAITYLRAPNGRRWKQKTYSYNGGLLKATEKVCVISVFEWYSAVGVRACLS